ncbi:OmpA family protein [Flavobacterium sp.]|uniref:OmpA family protein n=1 Tax=Flavobacterium sp. TaxID=239 RepID=UPI00286E0912|nr:OmpA family protein [Flavobacterium sp.]
MNKGVLLLLIFIFFNATYAQEQFSVYFDSNKYEPTPTELQSFQNWITQNKTSKIVGVYGFCDEDGSTKYNDTLASKRVNRIFQIINKRVKTRDDCKTRTFGELHQQSGAKAKNRKVTLFFLKEIDIPREAEILGLKPKDVVIPKKEIVFPETIIVQNPNGTSSEYKLDVNFMKNLDKAQKGEKLMLSNLNFVLNTFAITNESRGKLYELLLVMQQNPNLKINIQGHLCCIKVDKKDLSTQRGKAIYKFLEINNIDKTRMSYQGFGSTLPLFPVPEQTEAERQANRRVEIEIVDN